VLQWATGMACPAVRLAVARAAQRADDGSRNVAHCRPAARRVKLTMPPTRNANGKMKALIASAVAGRAL